MSVILAWWASITEGVRLDAMAEKKKLLIVDKSKSIELQGKWKVDNAWYDYEDFMNLCFTSSQNSWTKVKCYKNFIPHSQHGVYFCYLNETTHNYLYVLKTHNFWKPSTHACAAYGQPTRGDLQIFAMNMQFKEDDISMTWRAQT